MRKILVISSLILVWSIQVHGQKDSSMNLIQAGRSAYYFGDRPFKVGRSGVYFTNHGIRIFTYLPYIAFTRKFNDHLGLRISMEQYEAAYCKRGGAPCRPEVNEIFFRDFYQAQINGINFFSLSKKVKILLALNGSYRFAGSQSLVELYIDHGTWGEGFGRTDKVQGFGGGFGSEILIKPYKKFTLAIKGEMLYFFGEPKRQYGLGAALGYEF